MTVSILLFNLTLLCLLLSPVICGDSNIKLDERYKDLHRLFNRNDPCYAITIRRILDKVSMS